jgi:uncharacterized protein (DUF2344 family)
MKLFKKKTLGKTDVRVERTVQELQQEYNNYAAMVGDRQYKIRLNQRHTDFLMEEIEELLEKIDEVQKEAVKQKDKEQGKSLVASVSGALKNDGPQESA